MRLFRPLICAGFGLFIACGPEPRADGPSVPTLAASALATSEVVTPPTAEQKVWAPVVAISGPQTLATLETTGFTLANLVAGSDAKTNAELSTLPAFKSIFAVLETDVRAAQAGYPQAKVTTIEGWRLFDVAALSSPTMRFELIGAFNRLDRRAFNDGTCGEARFIYRLRYDTVQGGAPMSGRLPMTVNVVFVVGSPKDGCGAVARAWERGEGDETAWLTSEGGPFGSSQRANWTLKSIETNLQTLRLQSSVAQTMGGTVEYSLRVFHPRSDTTDLTFAPAPMENMPDVPALRASTELRAELIAFLRQDDALDALDQGTLRIPDKFLAKAATAVAPRGMSRLGNRPFSGALGADPFSDLDLSSYTTIRSPRALLRRLDAASCVGCHQSRSIAGFHAMGDDPEDVPAFTALVSGLSSHLRGDLERRSSYVAAIANGASPDEARPFPERQGVGNGYGAPCSLGDAGFADWTCGEGFTCIKLEDDEIGVCMETADAKGLGAPCEYGKNLPPQLDPRKDFVGTLAARGCKNNLSCRGNIHGFPLGACEAECSAKASNLACADFLDIDGFQNCLRFDFSFASCAKRYVYPIAERTCDTANPCRQDYVCVRTTSGAGACVPPYFVYPLRLDGVASQPRKKR